MSDIPKETPETNESNFHKINDEKPKNIRGIQGLDEVVEKHKAHEDADLAKDLEKFQDRPKPAYYKGDDLQSETQAQIQEANLRADQRASVALEKMQQRDIRWEKPTKTMQDHDAPFTTMTTMESFPEPPKVKNLTSDQVFYRYYGDKSERVSRWVTADHFNTPAEAQEKLSLPDSNSAEKEIKLRVDKGTTILDGKAAPRFGHEGGGNQIFVINDKAIHEVNEE